jgi:hypothetical protein
MHPATTGKRATDRTLTGLWELAASSPNMMMTSTPGQPLFTKSTKFNDLPDSVKKTFEDIEYVKFRCYFATLKTWLQSTHPGESSDQQGP